MEQDIPAAGIYWMTDPFYRAKPDDAPEDASSRYSVIAAYHICRSLLRLL
jgi:hypothetical protein